MAASQNRTFVFQMHFCPETCSERMEIPIWVKESMGGVIPRKLLLRSRFMNIWTVGITENGNGLYFQNGWEKFVRDNFLRNGDSMVFKYDGYGLFDFVLINPSGREKLVAIDAQARRMKELKEGNFVVVAGDNGDGRNDKDGNNFVIEGNKEDGEEVKALSLGLIGSNQKRDHDGGLKKVVCVGEGSSSRKNKEVLDPSRAKLFTSGQYKKTKNPCFVTTIGQHRRHPLHIPVDIIKDNNLTLPPTLILRDSRGGEWKANVRVWKDGRTWLSGGWQNLCQKNLVEEGDQCICKFMQPGTDNMFLQIIVVRKQATKNRMMSGRSHSV